jgi:nicotinamidase-related amidase
MMDALLIVDMQVGLRAGPPKHDIHGVVGRIDWLAAQVRSRQGTVIWIQHAGPAGDDFAPGRPGWALLPELTCAPEDRVISKTLNDSFAGTALQNILQRLAPERVLIAGWATDFCVDATVRSAVTRDHHVVAVGDAHTLNDRPHLVAVDVIRHHNWVWSNLIARRSVRVALAAELI